MSKTLHYLFDPLCGWCYGATAAVAGLIEAPGVVVKLAPTGLFADDGARAMNDAFAKYAWANDQRIEQLTGQRFSQSYRDRVLGDRLRRFDSGLATLALTAVSLMTTDSQREFEALKAIQHARYVDGLDVTSPDTLAGLLARLGLDAAAEQIARPDPELLRENRQRVEQARALMAELGARGVPTLVAEDGSKRWLVDASAAYADPAALLRQLEAA